MGSQKFIVKETKRGIGKGLYAGRAFRKGAYLLDYTGELITQKEADRRGTRYLFEVSGRWVIDGEGEENIARYINHSCEPNIEAVEEDGCVKFYALRDIAKGEELTFDYGEEYVKEFIAPTGCKCGAQTHKYGA